MRAGENVWTIETTKREKYGSQTRVKPYVAGPFLILAVGPYHAVLEREAAVPPEAAEPLWADTGKPPRYGRTALSKLFSTRKEAVATVKKRRQIEMEEAIRPGDYVACLMPNNTRVVNGLVVRLTAKCAEVMMEDGSTTANVFMARRINKKKLVLLRREKNNESG
ncbi:MAG TPA: hypothetical protein EYG51_22230 [Pseudomonadales bacterium]|nr:hypothetical protein [Pseudomonadales bacterium]